MKVVVYVLCYDDASEAQALQRFQYPWAHVIRVGQSKYMEGQMYLSILEDRAEEWEDADFVGTLSWRAPDKIDIPDFDQLCPRMQGADVIGLLPLPQTLLEQACYRHPRFMEVWHPLLTELGYTEEDITSDAIPAFMCNYWLATPAWMKRYCEFYKRAVHVLETHKGLQGALWSYPGYGTHLSLEKRMQIYGTPYIPYHPFVQERLPCFWFWKEQAVIVLVPEVASKLWEREYGGVPKFVPQRPACRKPSVTE